MKDKDKTKAQLIEEITALRQRVNDLESLTSKDRQTQLSEAIESLNEAYALYDAEDRLVICNSKYREVYDVSSDLLNINQPKVLAESWRKYEFLVNTSKDFMTLINADYVYEAVNDAYCQAHNQSRAELLGKSVRQVWGKKRYKTYIKSYLSQCFAGQIVNYQEGFEFATSGWRYFDVVCYPYRSASSIVTHVVVISRDITESKMAQKELQSSEERFRQVISSISDHIYVTRIKPQGQVTNLYTSPHTQRLTGYAATKFEPDESFWLSQVIHPEDRAIALMQVAELSAGRDSEVEYRLIRADGSIIWVRDSARVEDSGMANLVYGVVSDISAHKWSEEQLKQLNQELATLNTIVATINETSDLQTILVLSLEQIVALLDVDGAECHLLDLATDQLYFAAHYGLEPQFVAASQSYKFTSQVEVVGDVFAQGQPLYLPHIAAAERYLRQDMAAKVGYQTLLSVPMFRHETPLGIFSCYSRQHFDFSPNLRTLLMTIGRQLGVAIERARLHESERRRRQEAEMLREAAAALTSTLGLSEALDAILLYLEQVIPYDSSCIFLYQGDHLEAMTQRGLPHPEQVIGAKFYADNALSIALKETHWPICITDVQLDPRFETRGSTNYIRGWMGAPLIAHNKNIGHLSLDSRQVAAYDEDDATLVMAFANQAAIVIENAQLFEDTQAALTRTETLYYMARSLIVLDDLQEMLQTVVQGIIAAITADIVILVLIDIETQQIIHTFKEGPQTDLLTINSFEELKQDLSGWVLGELKPAILSKMVLSDPRQSREAQTKRIQENLGSIIVVPIYYQDKVFGTITTANHVDKPDFTSKDVDLISVMANQMAVTIENTLLFDQTQQEIAERKRAEAETKKLNEELEQRVLDRTIKLSALYDITAVASASTDLQTTLDQLLDRSLAAMQCDMGCIHTLDESQQILHMDAHQGLPPGLIKESESVPIGDYLVGEIIKQSKPLLVSNLQQDPRTPPTALKYGLLSYIGVPMRTRDQILGVLSLFGKKKEQFNTEELILLGTIGDQVGGIIDNARLHQQAKQSAIIEERERLARELHDSVTQLLYSLTLLTGGGQRLIKAGKLDDISAFLADLGGIAQQALKEMRLLVYQLRPASLEKEGLVGALRHRLDAVERRSNVETQLLIAGQPILPPSVEQGVYGIAREALNNALKHGNVSTIIVRINIAANALLLEIIDDGQGFDLESQQHRGGMGLANMCERAAQLGGVLKIDSNPGQGTRVQFELTSIIQS